MEESADNSWISSWISAAKLKSTEVLEFVKKDLEEFGNAVKSEASCVVSSTGSVLESTLRLNQPESTASSMKRSFSSFLGQMNNVLQQGPDDSDTEAILITEGCENVPLTKLQKILYELQKNEKTFLEDCDPSLQKQYLCWLDIAESDFAEDRLAKQLVNSLTLHNQYLSLVPNQVSHQLFWNRYLFKKALLEDELAREEAVEKKQLKEQQSAEELKWENEDFSNTEIELSEEEQIRLLQEYEAETKHKTKHKSTPSDTMLSKAVTVNKSAETTDSIKAELIQAEKQQLNEAKKTIPQSTEKAEFSTSLDLETKSSNSSSDGDWEKVNDLDK